MAHNANPAAGRHLSPLACMSLNMLRKPLLREGVSACCRPSMAMKSGGTWGRGGAEGGQVG